MDSGEDSVIKARKPYTITKQRERWTDEEHSRFLEALKLYGRAWQRIEDHIGTKTAVQIRSHAQKFFTKLEKEALDKGVPTVQALDIDIPPPRPKRKASNPYPRKTNVDSPTSQVRTRDEKLVTPKPSCQSKQILDLEKEQLYEIATGEEQKTNVDKQNHDNNSSAMESENNQLTCFLQSFPNFQPPIIPICHNQDDYRSFLHTPSTFPNLISCALLQNPAAQAAASFASTLWPHKNSETSAESSVCNHGGSSCIQLNSSPNIAAIAAATVAAASAWWASNGLLPLGAPFHTAFTSAPSVGIPVSGTTTDREFECFEKCPSRDQQVKAEQSKASQAQSSVSNALQLSVSKEGNDTKECADHEKDPRESELGDLNMEKRKKQMYRSSCGSNSTSSGEVEIDTEEEKKKEEAPEDLESGSGSKSTNNSIDSWKEVSEEGRLAFRALFSRDVLPQSFSPPQDKNVKHVESVKDVHLSLNLNCGSCPSDQSLERNVSLTGNKNEGQGLITIGFGQGKMFNHRRTGFKPYKRCSTESTENRVATSKNYGEDKSSKRTRFEKASS